MSVASARLRELIVFGDLRPGEPLRLEELSARLGMSVSPIREALRQLEMIGFVSHAPYRGASVTRLSLGEMEAVFESRVALETVVVRRAVKHFDATAALLTRILGDLDAAYAAEDRLTVVRADAGVPRRPRDRIRLGLARTSRHPGPRCVGALQRCRDPRRAAGDNVTIEARGHREILEALYTRDADTAEAALRRHLASSREIFTTLAMPSAIGLDSDAASPFDVDPEPARGT